MGSKIITKTDRASKPQIAQQLMAISELGEFADIVPVSAVADDQIELLADLLIARLPIGPQLYPDNIATDESDEARIAELIREAALADVVDMLWDDDGPIPILNRSNALMVTGRAPVCR